MGASFDKRRNSRRKTIFIVVSQTIIIRNILRSGLYKSLVHKGYRLVIFINCRRMPDYIYAEFPEATIVPLHEFPVGKIHRKFIEFTHLLLYTNTTRRYFRFSRHFVEKSRLLVFLHLLAVRVVSGISFFKPLARRIEKLFFKEKIDFVERYFEEYKPNLLFSTSITSKHDNVFLKAAARRGIRTISMPKSWDTVTKMYYRFIPDYFIVQNKHLKDGLVKLQDVSAERIFVVGYPQFDWYRREDILRRREDHLRKMGLDPGRSVIFFGSQGSWYDNDWRIADKIYEWVVNNKLAKPVQLLVRPHFSNVKTNTFVKYKGKPLSAYDDSYRITDDFRDNWDPSVEETVDFVNTIAHADVLVIILSTLALDGACRDKPVINVLFGAKYRKGKDITPFMQYTNHYEWVLETDATFRARNFEELKACINEALLHPEVKRDERRILREKVCYKVDGESTERLVEAIESVMRKA